MKKTILLALLALPLATYADGAEDMLSAEGRRKGQRKGGLVHVSPSVYERYYDCNGNVIPTRQEGGKTEWYVKLNNESTNETIIQTFP